MANKFDNLRPGEYQFTQEDKIKGGKASGEARRRKKTMKEMLQVCLEMQDKKGQSYQELATLGLIKGAMKGNAINYRTILELLGELKNPEEDKRAQELSKVEELLNKLTEEAKK